MKEEQNGAPKKKWSRIFRKKWFFPAVYISVAAILLTAVVWYQNVDNQVPETEDNQEAADHYTPDLYDEDAESVMEQSENIKMPVSDQEKAEIVTKFYDSNAEQEDKENALVFHNNRYYQSTGIDITLDDESFDVVASLSGEVEEVKEDPILGNVVTLSHGNDVMTYYASMDDITKEVGDEVKQGDELGTAGNNLFGKDIGPHVHFELRKSGESLNPEEFFNQSVSELDKVEVDEDKEKSDEDEGTDAGDVDEDMETDPGEGNENNDGDASNENDENADADSDENDDANADSNQNNEDEDADSNENNAGAGSDDNKDEDIDVDLNSENDLEDMDPEE